MNIKGLNQCTYLMSHLYIYMTEIVHLLCCLYTGNCVMCITYVIIMYVVFWVYYKRNSYTYIKCLEHKQYTYFTHVIWVYSLHMYYMCWPIHNTGVCTIRVLHVLNYVYYLNQQTCITGVAQLAILTLIPDNLSLG